MISPDLIGAFLAAVVGAVGATLIRRLDQLIEWMLKHLNLNVHPPSRKTLFIVLIFLFASGIIYSTARWLSTPQIRITEFPHDGMPGPGSHGEIVGAVCGVHPDGSWIAVYACVEGPCYIQPLDTDFHVQINNGKWRTWTHLGSSYTALLVDGTFKPQPQTNNPGGAGVLATDEVFTSVERHRSPDLGENTSMLFTALKYNPAVTCILALLGITIFIIITSQQLSRTEREIPISSSNREPL
jgi:hypothetical protein